MCLTYDYVLTSLTMCRPVRVTLHPPQPSYPPVQSEGLSNGTATGSFLWSLSTDSEAHSIRTKLSSALLCTHQNAHLHHVCIHILTGSHWCHTVDRIQQHLHPQKRCEPSKRDKKKDISVNTSTCVSKVNLYHSGSIVRLQIGPND